MAAFLGRRARHPLAIDMLIKRVDAIGGGIFRPENHQRDGDDQRQQEAVAPAAFAKCGKHQTCHHAAQQRANRIAGMMHPQREAALLFRPPLRGVADADGLAPAGPEVDANAQQHKRRQPVADRFNPGNKREGGIAQHQRYLKARPLPA